MPLDDYGTKNYVTYSLSVICGFCLNFSVFQKKYVSIQNLKFGTKCFLLCFGLSRNLELRNYLLYLTNRIIKNFDCDSYL